MNSSSRICKNELIAWIRRTSIVLLLAQGIASALGQQPAPTSTFKISLPLNINPESVYIQAGNSGRSLSLREMRTKAGVHDYSIGFNDSDLGVPRSLKLLIYIPGYRMIAREFRDAELDSGRPFIPPLVDLPKTVARGKLIDSSNNPLPNQSLNITYFLTEAMGYFGYFDGIVSPLLIGVVKTDSNGDFALTLPALAEDPFFDGSATKGRFYLHDDSKFMLFDQTLTPNSFPVQKVYEPFIVKKVQKGTLRGKLAREFFELNNLSPDLRVYAGPGDTIPTRLQLQASKDSGTLSINANLQTDGSFEAQLPAGIYDLELWVAEVDEKILIQGGVVVEENKTRIIDRP